MEPVGTPLKGSIRPFRVGMPVQSPGLPMHDPCPWPFRRWLHEMRTASYSTASASLGLLAQAQQEGLSEGEAERLLALQVRWLAISENCNFFRR